MASSDEIKLIPATKLSLDPWLFGLTFVLLFAVYSGTFFSFYNVYSEEGSDQSHAPLLLAVVLYLVYRAWSTDRQNIEIHTSFPFVFLLSLVSLLWLVAGLVFVEAGQQVSVILMLALVVLALLGVKPGRRYMVPILLLSIVLPIWNILVPYLQTSSAVFSAILLQMTGITITRDGYLLVIPGGTFEVADECSGLRFLVVSVILALVHTQLTRVHMKTLLVYLVMAVFMALISNVFRIYVVVMIGYLNGMEHELVNDHNSIGWAIFALLIFPYLLFGERYLRKRSIQFESHTETTQLKTHARTKSISGVVYVVLAFSLGPALLLYLNAADTQQVSDKIRIDTDMGAWKLHSSELEAWRPFWTKGDRELQGSFRNGRDIVDLYATQFLSQENGVEAVNISHRVYDIDKWSRISRSAKVVSLADGRKISVEETVLKSPANKRRLVWQWYGANGSFVQGKVEAKLSNLVGILSGNPDISVYILSKEVVKGEEHATKVLSDFAGHYLQI
jgi:EpsI family protein